MKQLIIARKDLQMSPGKLSAQVSHASMIFLTNQIKNKGQKYIYDNFGNYYYINNLYFDKDIYENWICGSFTKVVCEAKNKYQLEKSIGFAVELGLEEGKDFFLIKDNCYTELEPEEIDENGVGRTLTCIGFRPLPDEIVKEISRHYQLYK